MKVNNYIKTMINQSAKYTHTELTDEHIRILEYVYKYYDEHRVGPFYFNIKKQLGVSKEKIDKLFPYGLNSVYTWVGIPIQTTDKSCKPVTAINIEDYREIYLDHNATTYIRPEISSLLMKYYHGDLGFENPSSSTLQGKKAFDLISHARKTIANCLSIDDDEIVFTGCGSESNNFAIKGIAYKYLKKPGHIITSKTEHSSVLKSMKFLETLGFTISYLDVEHNGIINPEKIKKSIKKNTILVSIMAVNNEIGVINPINEIGKICKEKNIPFMVDAIQAFGKIKIHPKESGISLLSLSGHKIYAPKGIGALYIDKNIDIIPLIHGGSQESNYRAGTENVGHILALAKACDLICHEMEMERKRLHEIQNYFLNKIKEIEPGIIINGDLKNRIPNNLSIGFPGIDSGALLLSLNNIGICASAGSACSSGKIETSHVLKAIRADVKNYGTIRFSFGLKTIKSDINYLLKYFPEILKILKERQKS